MLAPNHYYNYMITITILERSLTQMSPWSSRYGFDIFSSNQIPQIRFYDILLSHQNCHLTTLNLIPFLYSVQPEENTDVTTDKKWSVVTNICCVQKLGVPKPSWSNHNWLSGKLVIMNIFWDFHLTLGLFDKDRFIQTFIFMYISIRKSSVRLLNMKAWCHEGS